MRRRSRYYVHPRFGQCASRSPKSMPIVFDELAAYNTRCADGVVHTVRYRERMAQMQADFNEWSREVL